jgi:hypothetical protein
MSAGTSKKPEHRKTNAKEWVFFPASYSDFSKQIFRSSDSQELFPCLQPDQSKPLYLCCDILEMLFEQQCLDGSVVERVLGKDEVAGSNPARGFFLFLFFLYILGQSLFFHWNIFTMYS